MTRPEHVAPPEIYYNEEKALKYSESSRIRYIQEVITTRAIELLALPHGVPAYILDIGCGSGISGQVLQEAGHVWVGVDISEPMLDAALSRDVDGDLILQDVGQGLRFRPGAFDGAISISAVQWLCNADSSGNIVKKRLAKFFNTLYSSLARGARAVLQFYPENPDQIQLIMMAVQRAGFTGGLVIDYPNSSKTKKHYLCIDAGISPNSKTVRELPAPITNENASQIHVHKGTKFPNKRKLRKGHSTGLSRREYVMHKKEVNRTKGKSVPRNSKYSGRKRPGCF